jgi:hypothetical protein
MRLPKSFSEITVGQYQECYFILKENPNDIDQWVKVIAVLSGKTPDEVSAMKIREIKSCVTRLNFILMPEFLQERAKQYIYAGGRVYKAILNAMDLSNANAIDIRHFLADGADAKDAAVKNAHKLLASIYQPLTWRGFRQDDKHPEHAERFKRAKMGDVYGALFFYSVLSTHLIKASLDYGVPILEEHLKELEEFKKSFSNDGDGMIQSTVSAKGIRRL